MTRTEYQLKFLEDIDISFLVENLEAEPHGRLIQQDVYLLSEKGIYRIRTEGERCILTQKGESFSCQVRAREVSEKVISKTEAEKLKKECTGEQVIVCKARNLFTLKDCSVALDEVEHLGNFVEVRASSEEKLSEVLKLLGLSEKESIKGSYLELMQLKDLPKWVQTVIRFHQKVGELSFGITSGILTTTGLMVGVNAATASQLPVIASIATIAVADSFSDAFGMYMSKTSERGTTRQEAIRYTGGTLLGKFLFPLTFIIPILFLPLHMGIMIDLLWGMIALALLSAEQAIVSQSSITKNVGWNLVLAILIIVASTKIGHLAAGLV